MRLVVLSVHSTDISAISDVAFYISALHFAFNACFSFDRLKYELRTQPFAIKCNYKHAGTPVTQTHNNHSTQWPSALYLYTVPSVHCVISPDILGASTLVCVSSLPHTCVCLTIVLSQYHALLRLLKKRKRTEQRIGRLQEPAVFCSLKKLTLPNASFSNLWASHIMLNSNFGQKWHRLHSP